ncbi:hypothetical protein QQX98_008447 [Neonectria punicea]|uniref:ribonuclease H n=1 Tax=Neonectria punicea TaxID=979145 RepID=A0ABR1GV58_9HYPO
MASNHSAPRPGRSYADGSDSDDSDGPIELPNGSLICRPHHLKICPYCCVDFSFMDELLEEEELEEEELEEELLGEERLERETNEPQGDIVKGPHLLDLFGRPIERGTGQVFPTKFALPSAASTPDELFPVGISHQASPSVVRFIRRDDAKQILIYADGACLNNGQANPKAGWAFYFKPGTDKNPGTVSSRLEARGPFDEEFGQTSNRAELRAIVGALRFRHWRGEGFTTMVLATDSEYVAEGATAWTRGWVRKGWKTSMGANVKNKDLWEALLGEVERWDSHGLKIQFWRIPRGLNTVADRAAKQAAENMGDEHIFNDISGALV